MKLFLFFVDFNFSSHLPEGNWEVWIYSLLLLDGLDRKFRDHERLSKDVTVFGSNLVESGLSTKKKSRSVSTYDLVLFFAALRSIGQILPLTEGSS